MTNFPYQGVLDYPANYPAAYVQAMTAIQFAWLQVGVRLPNLERTVVTGSDRHALELVCTESASNTIVKFSKGSWHYQTTVKYNSLEDLLKG